MLSGTAAGSLAQLSGTKRWVLFPPSDTPALYATRLPYEESSIYSPIDPQVGAAQVGAAQVGAVQVGAALSGSGVKWERR